MSFLNPTQNIPSNKRKLDQVDDVRKEIFNTTESDGLFFVDNDENLNSHFNKNSLSASVGEGGEEEEVEVDEEDEDEDEDDDSPENGDKINSYANHQQKKKFKTHTKLYRQKFIYAWLDDPKFKQWLLPVEDDESLCQCRVCPNKRFLAKKSVIELHAGGKRHIENMGRKEIILSKSNSLSGECNNVELKSHHPIKKLSQEKNETSQINILNSDLQPEPTNNSTCMQYLETSKPSNSCASNVLLWTEGQVKEWFIKNEIEIYIFEELRPCNGKTLKQLFKMKKEAPIFFYQSLKEFRGVKLTSIARFSFYLDETFESET